MEIPHLQNELNVSQSLLWLLSHGQDTGHVTCTFLTYSKFISQTQSLFPVSPWTKKWKNMLHPQLGHCGSLLLDCRSCDDCSELSPLGHCRGHTELFLSLLSLLIIMEVVAGQQCKLVFVDALNWRETCHHLFQRNLFFASVKRDGVSVESLSGEYLFYRQLISFLRTKKINRKWRHRSDDCPVVPAPSWFSASFTVFPSVLCFLSFCLFATAGNAS